MSSTVPRTSDAGFIAYRELDDALGLTEVAGGLFQDSRTGKNGRHGMVGQFRQSVYGRLGGYDDVNDADRLGRDPAIDRDAVTKTRFHQPIFETELLASIHELAALNPAIKVHDLANRRDVDMDSSVSPTHGEQEGTAYKLGYITLFSSTSSVIWSGAPCVPATFTAPMTGKAC